MKIRYVAYVVFFISVAIFLYCLVNPVYFVTENSENQDITADSNRLKKDVEFLANSKPARNYLEVASLNRVAQYIKTQFESSCNEVRYQDFTVDGDGYKNVICTFHGQSSEKIVVGAHYDVA